MEILGVIGCILAFVVFTIISYKNAAPAYAAIVSSMIIILFNRMDLIDTILNVHMVTAGGFVSSYFLMFLWGAIMGRLYSASGAAVSIAQALSKLFFRPTDTPVRKQVIAVLVVILSGGLLGYGGINLQVIVFTLYPLALSIFAEADIPKRFLAGAICGAIGTFVISAPGSPQVANIVGMDILGTTAMAAAIPGFIGVIVEIAVGTYFLNRLIVKAKNNGEKFEYGPKDVKFEDSDRKPHWAVALAPLVLMWGLFNFLHLNISFAQLAGVLLCIVLFRNYIKAPLKILNVVNEGSSDGARAIISIAMVIGFAGVVKSSTGFEVIVSALLAIKGNPYLILAIAVAISALFTGNASASMKLILPELASYFVKLGVPAGAIHRISTFACTTIDSVPSNPTVLMIINYTDTKVKDGYPAVFITTVFATSCATAVVALLLAFFPGLA